MLSGRQLLAKIIERLLNNEPLRELFLEDPLAALMAYHLDERDLRMLQNIKNIDGLQKAFERFSAKTQGSGGLTPKSLKDDLEAVASSGKARVVNTGFASDDLPQTPLLRDLPLLRNAPYFFWLEIGEPIAESIELIPTALPDDLPPKARLQVVLYGFDAEMIIATDIEIGELEVQPDGEVIVARDAFVPPGLRGENKLLNRRLFFPVKTPPEAGTYQLRCNIYFQQTLVQSRLITIEVSADARERAGALTSVLDYNLSHSLNGRQLQDMGSNRLSIMLNDNGNGTHGLRFFGADDSAQKKELFKNDTTLTEGALQDLINQARDALRTVAWGGGTFKPNKPYRYGKSVSDNMLTKDLVLLAKAGYRFYRALINDLANGRSGSRELEKLMQSSGQIQIASKQAARLVIPAALFYDYPLDSSLGSSDYTLCQTFAKSLEGDTLLEETACFQGNCPTREDMATVCPSGFWGYRHRLGLPLDVANAPDAPTAIPIKDKVEITIGVSTDPVFKLRKGHEEALQKLQDGLIWNYADSRDEALEAMRETSPHVMYFYCHGGLSGTVPFIHVGDPKKDRGITPDNLGAFDIYWEGKRPLVFINGCHTTALEPDAAIDFVTEFVRESAAAGVIGTEITLFEPIAVTFSEECLKRFLVERQTIGAAVRGARLKMLHERNPLGLVYIPYVMANLKLV